MAVQISAQVKNKSVLNKMMRRLPLLPMFVAQQITFYAAERLEASSREAAPIWQGNLKNSIEYEVDKRPDGADATIFSGADYATDVHEGGIPQPGLSDNAGKIVEIARWRHAKVPQIPLGRIIDSLEKRGIKHFTPFFEIAYERFNVESGVFQGIAIAAIKKSVSKL